MADPKSTTAERAAADAILNALDADVSELLCVFEAFRRLGFRSDDIFFAHDDEGQIGIVLRWAHGKGFTVYVGETKLSHGAFREHWTAAADAWNTGSDDMLERLWERSKIREKCGPPVAALMKKGVRIPDPDAIRRMN